MLIDFRSLDIKKPVKGVIHVGAHDCEEREPYLSNFNITD